MSSADKDRIAKWLLALIVMSVAAVFVYSSLEPSRHDGQIESLCERVKYEYYNYGLDVPSNMRDYYSSVMGSPHRYLQGKVIKHSHPLNPAVMENIRYKWDSDPAREPKWIVKYDEFSRLLHIWPIHRREQLKIYSGSRYPSPEKTVVLLTSVSMGTELWKQGVRRNGSYFWPKTTMIDPVPAISFDRPATKKDLDEYWQWLKKMTGSLDRFNDDWGHRIRLAIKDGSNLTILAASSAGPDGKWGTSDDLILKRDIRSGRIISKVGF